MVIAPFRCWAVLLTLFCAVSTHAEPTLDPYTVKSASGRFALSVAPSNIDGSGKAGYSLTDAGKPVWAGEQLFTLWNAAVADDGTVCGFAYNNGYDGRGGGEGDPVLLCVIIDPAGKVRLEDGHARQHSGILSTPPAPYHPLGLGITLDEANDRFIVRATRGSFDTERFWWWRYKVSSGESLGEVEPDRPEKAPNGGGFHKEMSADLVPGTPLVLVHWYIYQRGARFALLDAQGKEVWKLDQPEEYAQLGKDFSWWWSLGEKGIRQTDVRRGGFDVISYAMNARVTFAITTEPGTAAFSVTETGRREEKPAPKAPEKKSEALREMALEPAGIIELRAPVPTSPIDNVHEFNIDARGRLGFVRWTNVQGRTRFVVVAPDGSVVADVPVELGDDSKGRMPVAAPVEGDRWVIVRSSYDEARRTQAWWVDVATGELTAVEGFEAGVIERLLTVPGGGFAAEGGYRSQESVVLFDTEAKRRVAVRAGRMKSAAVRTDGSVAVLNSVPAAIEWFDAQGQSTGSDKIEDIIGYKPNYPSTIRADRDGGVILEDFRGDPPIILIGADKKVVATMTPRFKDGSHFRPLGGVQRAPDGTIWTADGHALLRLTEDGVVDRILGPSPTADELSAVNDLAIGPNGLIYVTDARTSAVHVFDTTGNRLRVHQQAAGDFSNTEKAQELAIAPDGSVWARAAHAGDPFGTANYFGIDADGVRLEPRPCTLDRIRETWLFQPRTGRRWILGYKELWLADERGEVVRTITHRPSGAWLARVGEAAVAPDGSLAVITGPAGLGMRGPAELNIFSAAGEPVKTVALPDQWTSMRLAFNGRWAITADDTELHLFNIQTGDAGRFPLPAAPGTRPFWFVHTSPDGSEVWVRDSRNRLITRFKLPL